MPQRLGAAESIHLPYIQTQTNLATGFPTNERDFALGTDGFASDRSARIWGEGGSVSDKLTKLLPGLQTGTCV